MDGAFCGAIDWAFISMQPCRMCSALSFEHTERGLWVRKSPRYYYSCPWMFVTQEFPILEDPPKILLRKTIKNTEAGGIWNFWIFEFGMWDSGFCRALQTREAVFEKKCRFGRGSVAVWDKLSFSVFLVEWSERGNRAKRGLQLIVCRIPTCWGSLCIEIWSVTDRRHRPYL